MIIACTSCPAQYSVPDAKVAGKKVRVTCKHCGAGIVVDATRPAAEDAAAIVAVLPRASETPLPSEDATLLMQRDKPSGWEHDEPTVFGQVPQATLDAERAFSQRTVPPPAMPTPATVSAGSPAEPQALPEQPERAQDLTRAASPQAHRSSGASIEPPAGAAPDVKTMVSEPDIRLPARSQSRAALWAVGVLGLLLVVVLFILRAR